MILVSDLINGDDGVRVTLLDPAKRTWSDPELVGYFNEFQNTTAFLKPDAYTRRVFIPMEAGTNQQLPDDGIAIMELDQNEATGRVATLVDRDLLTHQNRFWPASTMERDVQHWAADPRDPRRFDITPPNNGYGSVKCLYGAVPEVVDLDGSMAFPDSYQYAAKCFVLAKAYAKNSQRQDLSKTSAYMAEYRQALGIKSTAQVAVAPRVGSTPGSGGG